MARPDLSCVRAVPDPALTHEPREHDWARVFSMPGKKIVARKK